MSELHLTAAVRQAMIDHAAAEYPLEACGLLAGQGTTASAFYPMTNTAQSARVYALDDREFMGADREADDAGLEIIGVFHSHTHTAAFPSPTDVAQASVPSWHYVLVSLEHAEPSVRSFAIVDGNITEETVVPTA